VRSSPAMSTLLLRLVSALERAGEGRPASTLAARAFLVGLAIVHAIFFASLSLEVGGLVGSDGILPAERLFTRAHERLGADAYLRLPSLYWLAADDTTITLFLAGGALLAVAVVVVVVFRGARAHTLAWCALVGLYTIDLSLLAVGQTFLAFQWDLLLVESTVLALFFARAARPGGAPSRFAVVVLRLLVVKLMMSSGIGKLATGDETWRDLSALSFHLFTQPLPNPIAVVVADAPRVLLETATLLTLVVQIAVPPFVFVARARPIALGVLALHQLAIAATGNFAYFNVLTLVLLVAACDDDTLTRLPFVRRANDDEGSAPSRSVLGTRSSLASLALLSLLAVLSGRAFVEGAFRGAPPLPVVDALADALAPLRLSSRYGLFTVMTTERREIVFEGSDDGVTWTPFELHHQPGDPRRWPTFVAPHQPRLDWQMWFAALSSHERNPFVVSTMRALVEGRASVRALFRDPLFAERPPRAVRARFFRYTLAPAEVRRAEGLVWQRVLLGEYAPQIGARFQPVVDDEGAPSAMP